MFRIHVSAFILQLIAVGKYCKKKPPGIINKLLFRNELVAVVFEITSFHLLILFKWYFYIFPSREFLFAANILFNDEWRKGYSFQPKY